MKPVELIALTGCSRPEDGRGCDLCLATAEYHFEAVLRAGLVVVFPDDLDVILNQGDQAAGWSCYSDACNRLRAALPERTDQ